MKLSISLSDEDVEFLDEYASEHGVPSRSAVLKYAVALLRSRALAASYEQAWSEWEASGEAELWEPVTADGVRGP